jgi:hypothetical protein
MFFGFMSFIFCILLIVRPSHNFVVCPRSVAGHWRLIRLSVGWFRVVPLGGNQLVHELDQTIHPYMVPHLWKDLYVCSPTCLHGMDRDSFTFIIPVLAAWSCYISWAVLQLHVWLEIKWHYFQLASVLCRFELQQVVLAIVCVHTRLELRTCAIFSDCVCVCIAGMF